MLRTETRELLVKAFEKTHNAHEVAECFSVDLSTVYRIVERKRATGSVKPLTYLRGRKAALTAQDLQNIDNLLKEQPDITIQEIIEKLHLHACNETVRKATLKLGYTYKKKSIYAAERDRSRGKTSKETVERAYVREQKE